MLMTVLMNSLNFGMSGNRETQIVPLSKEKAKENRLSDQVRSEKSIDVEMFVRQTIRKEKCLRLQRQ